MRALLIANREDADSGFVGFRFRHHGYSFDECHREDPGGWPALDGHDLVLLLGSEWSVYWPHVEGEVRAETDLIREAHSRRVPMFGICFGNQSMAHALGGTVERGREPEIGWCDIVSDDPLHIAEGPWMQWHSDVVTVPPHAAELARSGVGPQAWRLGRSFAVQFHPEATETVLARWTSLGGGELAAMGSSPDELMELTRKHVADSRPRAEALVDWFLEAIAH